MRASSSDWRRRWCSETRAMIKIAMPIVGANLLAMGMQLTDLMFVGRLGKVELGAAALGNTVFYLIHYPLLGAMTAIDTLLATAWGAGNVHAYADWTQTSLCVITALCVPTIAVLCFVEELLLGIGQDQELSRLAGDFCKQLVWGLPPYYWFQVFSKFLQAQHILAPPVYMGVVANLINVVFNWVFIFGPVGMGFRGAPVATSLCRWFQLLSAVVYLRVWPDRWRSTRPPQFLLPMRKLKGLLPGFWKLAGPGAVMMLIEAWSFEITTLLAGYLGTVELDAHLTVMQLATLSFLSLPFAVAIAATIRIGNLLGAGDAQSASDAMYVTFCICLGFMSICGVIFASCANYLGFVFTDDADVVKAAAGIAYIAALFQLADGGQAAAGGVFRGMGRQVTVAMRNFFGFWVFGIPCGAILTFAFDTGLAGLWWGLTVGLAVVNVVSMFELMRVDWSLEVGKAAERAVPCQNQNAVVVASAQEIAAEKAEPSATGDSTCAPVGGGCGQDPYAGTSSSGTRERGSGVLEVCKSGAIVQKLEPEERSRADTRMLQFAVVDASKPDPLL